MSGSRPGDRSAGTEGHDVIRMVFVALAVLAASLAVGVAVVVPVARLLHIHLVDRPIVFEAPAGYRGWAEVDYEDPRCPSLRSRGLFLAVPISSTGRGCTPTPLFKGWRYFRFVWVTPDGGRRPVEGRILGADPLAKRLRIFVGPAEAMRSPGRHAPGE